MSIFGLLSVFPCLELIGGILLILFISILLYIVSFLTGFEISKLGLILSGLLEPTNKFYHSHKIVSYLIGVIIFLLIIWIVIRLQSYRERKTTKN